MQRVSILCTDPGHPVNPHLETWAGEQSRRATVEITRDCRDLAGGDFLFLVSCHQIIGEATRRKYRHTLVLHASPLPKGRGMSPHIWALVEGANSVTLSMLNAEDVLDSGDIWQQRMISFDGTELYDEINAKLFAAETELMTWAIDHCDTHTPWAQEGEPSFYRKRTPADSRIDPLRPLVESFDVLRVADPDRYPAFFEHRGQLYRIRIEKI